MMYPVSGPATVFTILILEWIPGSTPSDQGQIVENYSHCDNLPSIPGCTVCELRRQWAYSDSPLQVTAHALYILLHCGEGKSLRPRYLSVSNDMSVFGNIDPWNHINISTVLRCKHCSIKHFYQFANVSSLFYAHLEDLSPTHMWIVRRLGRRFFFILFFFLGGGGYYWC